ncbi:hypothetical protein [Paracoccus sp. NSM]|uniref:hypothetical protein n=1 Tax=Paracoccus sp. NSM TaxID=3457784 RepID=UPI0040366B6A
MTQQNDGHGQDSNTMQTAAQEAGRTRGLARWYWGTAGLLIVVALGMSTFAGRQVTQGGPQGQEQAESARGWTDAAMRKAEQAAMEVVNKIDPELEAAFAPVYAGIPRYLDFHYSLKGEWLELSASVLNQMESELERHLFDGLDDKIERISQELQIDFHQRWRASIEASLAESPAATGPFAELARLSIEDARDRIEKTAVVVGVGTAALAVVPRIVAKKLGTRIAGKVAIKTGARMATVASGAGAGGILCSWAGPAAAACAVGGGVISWVTVDLAMIKLDEHVNRDEFQQKLRDLISEQKAAIRTDLHNLVTERLLGSAQATRKDTVMTISLAELPDYIRRVACEAVDKIMPH